MNSKSKTTMHKPAAVANTQETFQSSLKERTSAVLPPWYTAATGNEVKAKANLKPQPSQHTTIGHGSLPPLKLPVKRPTRPIYGSIGSISTSSSSLGSPNHESSRIFSSSEVFEAKNSSTSTSTSSGNLSSTSAKSTRSSSIKIEKSKSEVSSKSEVNLNSESNSKSSKGLQQNLKKPAKHRVYKPQIEVQNHYFGWPAQCPLPMHPRLDICVCSTRRRNHCNVDLRAFPTAEWDPNKPAVCTTHTNPPGLGGSFLYVGSANSRPRNENYA